MAFKIVSSDYDEDMSRKLSPRQMVRLFSREKAKAVAQKYKNSVVIGADTVVVFEGRIFGKPKNRADAKKMLRALSGKMNLVVTGYTIWHGKTGKNISRVVETKVYVRKISDQEIDNYVATGEAMDKAGAFAGHGLGSIFIERIDGDFFNMAGLPMHNVVLDLKKFGVKVI